MSVWRSNLEKIGIAFVILWLALLVGYIARADEGPVLYVPPNYGFVTDQPESPCLECFPMLWVRGEGIHRIGLTGVRFALWSPPMRNPWPVPKSHMTVSLNYWGTDSLRTGATLALSGFQDPTRTFVGAVGVDSTSVLDVAGSGALVTGSPSDSVWTVKAWVRVTNPTWPSAWTDTTYKALKAVLEGGIEGRPANVVFYATSNRRHLMPREMIENERATAINPGETVDEKLSLSDRFGLWIGFHNCSQDEYLAMVRGYADHYRLAVPDAVLREEALAWALARGGRSGRVAWQYIQDLAGRLGTRL